MKGEEEYLSVSPKAVSNPPLESRGRPAEHQKSPKKKSGRLHMNSGSSDGTSSGTTSSNALPLEYSPIRHRSAIERVLSALQGRDPILDSAPKVWTTFAVAKNLEITHSPLEDYIIRWLRAYPNSYFLEVLPEVSHEIACGLQNYDLARDSFAILVGEEALDSLRHIREPCVYKRTSFGRKKEALPEPIHTRIEYASKSFLERINGDFSTFTNSMDWIDELPEVRQLSVHTLPKIQDTVHKLRDLLKDYVRGTIYRVLCADYDTVPGPERQNNGGLDLLPTVERAAVWAKIPLNERILTRTYWDALKSFSLFYGESNIDFEVGWNASSSRYRPTHTENGEMDRGTYRVVRDSELKALIRDGQIHLKAQKTLHYAQQEPSAESLTTWSSTLPDRTNDGTQGHTQLGDLLLAHTSEHKLGHAQADSNVECLPVQSYALPDRTSSGASDVATKKEASIAKPAQPINIMKPLKRTQDFPDALSPSDEQFGFNKQSNFNVRTKWPFGAAREDPVAQVQKSVDGLHFSTTDKALNGSADQESRTEGIPIMSDPWRGYSDQLRKTHETLRHLAANADSEHGRSLTSRKSRFASCWDGTSARPLENLDLAVPNIWTAHRNHHEDDGAQESSDELISTGCKLAPNFFDLEAFFREAQKYIEIFATNKLRSPSNLELGIVNTLVCLEDAEWKYLPLYAGGNDDESNGVYNDDLPTAEHGFTTAGPEIHDGSTPVTSVKSPSEFEFVSGEDSASTINASTATNRGFSDTIRRGHVHAVDSVDGSMSDSFTMMTPSVDSDDEETFARKQIEAQERIEQAEEAANAANEERRMTKGKGKMVDEDESYADLFDGEEEEEEEEEGNDTDRAEVNDDDDEDEEDMVMV